MAYHDQFTLEDCLEWLREHVSAEDIAYIRALPVEDIFQLHHSLGMAIRNNCNLWKDGTDKLVKDLEHFLWVGLLEDPLKLSQDKANRDQSDSIYHPDNCSSLVLRAYHGYLNGQISRGQFERTEEWTR